VCRSGCAPMLSAILLLQRVSVWLAKVDMQSEICNAQLGCQMPLRAESLRTHAVPAGHAVHRRVDELCLCRGMTSARTTRASAYSSAGQCGHIIHPVCWLPNSTAMLPCTLVATEQCRALLRAPALAW